MSKRINYHFYPGRSFITDIHKSIADSRTLKKARINLRGNRLLVLDRIRTNQIYLHILSSLINQDSANGDSQHERRN